MISAHLASQLDRNRSGNAGSEINAELGARGIVKRRGKTNIRIADIVFAIFEAGRLTSDFDITLEAEALIVRDKLECARFQFLIHRQFVDGKGRRDRHSPNKACLLL